jgi:hypothetical protein
MAATPGEFLNQIEVVLQEGKLGPNPAVSALMERESWDRKVEELSGIIASLDGKGQRSALPVPVGQAA